MTTKKDPLGANPLLSQGIFSKTVTDTNVTKPVVTSKQLPVTRNRKPVSGIKKPEYGFLQDVEREKITLQIPIELNEWLDSLVKQGKRKFGHKIPKQIWIQAGIELLRAIPIELEAIDSEEKLRQELNQYVGK